MSAEDAAGRWRNAADGGRGHGSGEAMMPIPVAS